MLDVFLLKEWTFLAEDHRSSDLGVTFCFYCVLF